MAIGLALITSCRKRTGWLHSLQVSCSPTISTSCRSIALSRASVTTSFASPGWMVYKSFCLFRTQKIHPRGKRNCVRMCVVCVCFFLHLHPSTQSTLDEDFFLVMECDTSFLSFARSVSILLARTLLTNTYWHLLYDREIARPPSHKKKPTEHQNTFPHRYTNTFWDRKMVTKKKNGTPLAWLMCGLISLVRCVRLLACFSWLSISRSRMRDVLPLPFFSLLLLKEAVLAQPPPILSSSTYYGTIFFWSSMFLLPGKTAQKIPKPHPVRSRSVAVSLCFLIIVNLHTSRAHFRSKIPTGMMSFQLDVEWKNCQKKTGKQKIPFRQSPAWCYERCGRFKGDKSCPL